MRSVRRVLLISLLLAAGCSGGDPEAADPPFAVEQESAADADAIEVEATEIIYLPDQVGGNFHTVLVLLRNASDEVAIDVGGQISIVLGERLLKSINPIPVNILPGQRAAWTEMAIDLSEPARDAVIEVSVSVGRLREGPATSPVSFSNVTFESNPDGIHGCSISGQVSNEFSEVKRDLQIRAVGLQGESIVTGGFTYVDQVFPGQDATWSIDLLSPSECPDGVNQVLVLPNLGEDKIFSS